MLNSTDAVALSSFADRFKNHVWHTDLQGMSRTRRLLAPLGDKAEEIALRFVDFIDKTSVSVLGYIGFGMLFYTVISLMQKIERAFNFVWRVERDRSFAERVRDYLTLIFVGGVISGLLWNAGGLDFAAFVGNSGNYSAIYSGFATAIFFMIWLYVGWMILLIGCSISFYIQNPYSASQQSVVLSIRMHEKLAFAIAAIIGERYYQGQSPLSADSIADKLAVPSQLIESVLAPMESAQLVIRTQGDGTGYVPARSWETIPISDLIACIRSQDETILRSELPMEDTHASSMWASFEDGLASGVTGFTLKDLANEDGQK